MSTPLAILIVAAMLAGSVVVGFVVADALGRHIRQKRDRPMPSTTETGKTPHDEPYTAEKPPQSRHRTRGGTT